MTKPFICAVNGICCGARLDMVTTGDIVIASHDATFFDPHVTIGIVSGREMVRLARVLPLNITMRLALMGRHERMSAQRAYEPGLVSELVAPDRLLDRAKEIAAIINSNAPLAVRGTRLAIRKSLSLPIYEAELLSESYRMRVAVSEDAKEGPRAFAEKRAPDWKVRKPLRCDDPSRPIAAARYNSGWPCASISEPRSTRRIASPEHPRARSCRSNISRVCRASSTWFRVNAPLMSCTTA